MMDANDAAELSQALVDHEVAELGRIDTYSGHIESHGEVTFLVKDLGGSPRWSVQVYNEAGVRMGGDVQDSLPNAVKGSSTSPG